MVVLEELDVDPNFCKVVPAVGLDEESALVHVDSRRQKHVAFEARRQSLESRHVTPIA